MNGDPVTSPYELALARNHGYDFLGQLWLHGVTRDVMDMVAQVPELSAVLGAAPADFDDLAATHQQILGFDVFPFQSIFLDPSGLLGGTQTDRVLHAYAAAGFDFATADSAGDHIGHQLAFLAFLCGAEADAWEDGLPAIAQAMQDRQTRFMQDHLLRWIAPLTLAVKQQAQPFYTALAELTLSQVADHVSEQAAGGVQDLLAPAPSFALPTPPDLLADAKTSLKDIAEHLLRPVHSGLTLSRDDLTRLSRSLDLPRGFGDRVQMLTNLMRAAVTYGLWEKLIGNLREVGADWQTAYTAVGAESPALAEFVRPWAGQVERTIGLLEQIAQSKELVEDR